MFRLIRESIASKVTLLIIVLVTITATMVGMIFYIGGVNYFTENEMGIIETNLVRYEKSVQFYLKQIQFKTNYLKIILRNSTASQISSAIYQAKGVTGDKIKVFQIDNVGKVQYVLENDSWIYPQGENFFLNKLEIKKLSTLGDGESFIGKFRLKRKGGLIQRPFQTQILSIANIDNKFYVFLFNSDVLFDQINTENDKADQIILFNNSGEILYHPNPVLNLGHDLNVKFDIRDDFKFLETNGFFIPNGTITSGRLNTDYRGDKTIVAFRKIVFDEYIGGFFGVLITTPQSSMVTNIRTIRGQSIIFSIILIVLTAFVAWFFTKYLMKNLDHITSEAKKYTQGETDIKISIDSSDEIGILALTFQGMIRQVNERARVLKKSERKIREARDQAEKALTAKSQLLDDIRRQKIEIENIARDKDELLAIVSHDLKNPLAVVETSMDILREDESIIGNQNATDLVRRSKANAQYALNLITDLLDLARLEGGIRLDFEKFSVNEMIEIIVDSLDIKAKEKSINVEVNCLGSIFLMGDYGRLVQVINNIVGNALKFTPVNGYIHLNLSVIEKTRKVDGTNEYLRIEIVDNGPGIPEDKVYSIFEKFSQARKDDRKIGTGLGLAICKNIVELHSGKIWVESKEGEGSKFIIEIPRVITEDVSNVEHIKLQKNGSLFILGEDEEFNEKIFTYFSSKEFQVKVFSDFDTFHNSVLNEGPSLLFIDIESTNVDRFNQIKQLQDDGLGDIPIVALSHHFNNVDLDILKKNVINIVYKDSEFTDIENTVFQIINPHGFEIGVHDLDQTLPSVLVVDDEEIIRDLIAEKIESLNMNAIKAKSGVEALFLYKKYNIDLVITDIRMQEVDGISLTRLLKEEDWNLPVILMSANLSSLPKDLEEKLGVSMLLGKPFDLEEVGNTITNILSEKLSSNTLKLVEKQSEPEEVTQSNLPKMLVVDDSEDMRTLFQVLMKSESVELFLAEEGVASLDLFTKHDFQFVFLDMKMPGMSGDQVLSEMKKLKPELNCKYVVISANNNEQDQKDYVDMGFDYCMGKPINKKKIKEVIES